MIRAVVLDTGLLGEILHPRENPEIEDWLENLAKNRARVYLPEIADYEVRRKLLHLGKLRSVARLDALREQVIYLPLNTQVMRRAAVLWAEARKRGKPTADPKELDGDVILAA